MIDTYGGCSQQLRAKSKSLWCSTHDLLCGVFASAWLMHGQRLWRRRLQAATHIRWRLTRPRVMTLKARRRNLSEARVCVCESMRWWKGVNKAPVTHKSALAIISGHVVLGITRWHWVEVVLEASAMPCTLPVDQSLGVRLNRVAILVRCSETTILMGEIASQPCVWTDEERTRCGSGGRSPCRQSRQRCQILLKRVRNPLNPNRH